MKTQDVDEFSSWPLSYGTSPDFGSKVEFTWEKVKETANQVVFKNTGKHLSDIETKVLQGAWDGKTYEEMAQIHGYSAEYLNKDIGNKLWRKLSVFLGEPVTKKNFTEALSRVNPESLPTDNFTRTSVQISKKYPPFPEGSVALDSQFYLERDSSESLCYENIIKTGSLIRIKAPKLMGKTSLMNRIIAYAASQNYQAVYLDLSSVDRGIVTNLDKFLRWLCLKVGRQLHLENQLNEYWDTDILGSNDNCTAYFEEYLLGEIDCPLVLGLDDVDRLFPYTEVIEDFFGMLRSWHEKGKMSNIWKKLRLVIAHSTEIYIPLDINKSPFNAGVPVELHEFNQKQVDTLARLHELYWNHSQIEQLMAMVGGHPHLLRLAMYYICSDQISLEQLLQEAPTEAGIYSNHLRRLWETLQQVSDLAEAFKTVVTSSQAVELDSMQIYKLHSMGLVQRQGNKVIPRCRLYREYFRRVLA